MIQLALDRLSMEKCISITKQTYSYIDFIEIGTGVIKEYGMEVIREFRKLFPDKYLVADMKTCDSGEHETRQAFEAGADITTVMGFSNEQTIIESIQVAKKYSKKVIVDLLQTPFSKFSGLNELGVECISIHIGKDVQRKETIVIPEEYELLTKQYKTFVAGGISPKTIHHFDKLQPNVYIVGAFITQSENPVEATKKLKGVIEKRNGHPFTNH